MSSAPPNVVLVVAHDLGRHVGCYDVPTVETPNIDAIADEGVRFENSFTASPVCSPSRAAMVTGRYPHSNGVVGLVHRNFAWDLGSGERHLADLLGAAGYETALAGLQHECRNPDERFDHLLTPTPTIVPDETIKYDNVAEHAAEFVHDSDDPFYLQVGFVETHHDPKWAEGDYWSEVFDDYSDEATLPEFMQDSPAAREEMAAFEDAVELVDEAVGTISGALAEAGVEGDTLILFTSDHGLPLPRAKSTPYDPGIETTLVARLPGSFDGGVVHTDPVVNVDYTPTILDLAGVEGPENVQGRSLVPEVTGGADGREAVFGEIGYSDPKRWVRTADHKLVVNFTVTGGPNPGDPAEPPGAAQYVDDTLAGFRETVELYDIAADPHETENLAYETEHRETCRALLDRLHAWMRETDDPLLEQGPLTSPGHDRALAALRDGELRLPTRDPGE
jgi:arylsulfatase A-like enzyme